MAIGWFFDRQEIDAFRFDGARVTIRIILWSASDRSSFITKPSLKGLKRGKKQFFASHVLAKNKIVRLKQQGTIDALFHTTKKSLHVMRRGGNSVALAG